MDSYTVILDYCGILYLWWIVGLYVRIFHVFVDYCTDHVFSVIVEMYKMVDMSCVFFRFLMIKFIEITQNVLASYIRVSPEGGVLSLHEGVRLINRGSLYSSIYGTWVVSVQCIFSCKRY